MKIERKMEEKMRRIVLAEREKRFFKQLDFFCQKNYQREGILEKGSSFEEIPDIFLGVFDEEYCHCLGTLGIKFSNSNDLLPLEKWVKLNGDFAKTKGKIEFIRFSLKKKMRKEEKILVVRDLFDAAVRFFSLSLAIEPFLKLNRFEMFAFTFKEVVKLFELAVGMKVFKEIEGEILIDKIPPQSRCFLKRDPKIFQVLPGVISQRWCQIKLFF